MKTATFFRHAELFQSLHSTSDVVGESLHWREHVHIQTILMRLSGSVCVQAAATQSSHSNIRIKITTFQDLWQEKIGTILIPFWAGNNYVYSKTTHSEANVTQLFITSSAIRHNFITAMRSWSVWFIYTDCWMILILSASQLTCWPN